MRSITMKAALAAMIIAVPLSGAFAANGNGGTGATAATAAALTGTSPRSVGLTASTRFTTTRRLWA